MPTDSTIVYTHTDEAPMLATYSLLPIVRAFAARAGVDLAVADISLAGRIIAAFPEYLREDQRQDDALAQLGALAKRPEANIVKLPNISASIPQLRATIAELQSQGYDLPEFPAEPATPEEEAIRARYGAVLGSAVNPVLREGNSDRRVAAPVKEYARKNPHPMGAWAPDSRSHVAHMDHGDFFGSEQSVVLAEPTTARIELTPATGDTQVLKSGIDLLAGEVLDAAVMSKRALRAFFAEQIADAKHRGVLFSLHLKATMMKVSDPIMFGHCVNEFFADVLDQHAETFASLGVDTAYGLADLHKRLETLDADERAAIEADLDACYRKRPPLAMVDSDRGISNLHVPSDIIIDASMPAMIRSSGQMWGPDGSQQDTKAVIPDRSYAGIYRETIDFCRSHGAFDPATMGNVSNVGLMAQKAEEYGSHDKTFEIPTTGTVRVVAEDGTVLLEHPVERGDIWRACQTKDAAIRDWVALAVRRARATGAPAVFWLDADRAHDAQLIRIVERYLGDHDTDGLELRIMPPAEATRYTLRRCKDGTDTISVTGNVLRDYLTDLFPILELGTSAKMLSIVPLLAGGGLYETGAGGSAPKHVQQLQKENHLRWDSLGEFLALGVSLHDLGEKTGNGKCCQLAEALNAAIGKLLEERKAPSRKCGELDNRGSHFYLALYWAEALAARGEATFAELHRTLSDQEATIVAELNGVQGEPVDLGGYYHPNDEQATRVMRPSPTLNAAIDALTA